MEIKYEPVFGPQELFDNEFEPNAIAVIFIDRTNKLHATSEAEIDRQLQRTGSYVVAMRRIIRTPIWSLADQKAGKSPEVGSMLNHKTEGECTFIGFGVDNKTFWALKLKNDLIYIADKNWCTPIETPSEKAQREEDEFVVAMLDAASQEQLMSAGFKSGVIAAYRKLKGGE